MQQNDRPLAAAAAGIKLAFKMELVDPSGPPLPVRATVVVVVAVAVVVVVVGVAVVVVVVVGVIVVVVGCMSSP